MQGVVVREFSKRALTQRGPILQKVLMKRV